MPYCVDLCYIEQFGSYSMAVEELKVLSLQFIVSKVKHKIAIHVSRKNKAKSYNEQFLLCLCTCYKKRSYLDIQFIFHFFLNTNR